MICWSAAGDGVRCVSVKEVARDTRARARLCSMMPSIIDCSSAFRISGPVCQSRSLFLSVQPCVLMATPDHPLQARNRRYLGRGPGMASDLVAVWEVPLNDKVHRIEFEHGTTTGKRVIRVDGQVSWPLPATRQANVSLFSNRRPSVETGCSSWSATRPSNLLIRSHAKYRSVQRMALHMTTSCTSMVTFGRNSRNCSRRQRKRGA